MRFGNKALRDFINGENKHETFFYKFRQHRSNFVCFKLAWPLTSPTNATTIIEQPYNRWHLFCDIMTEDIKNKHSKQFITCIIH